MIQLSQIRMETNPQSYTRGNHLYKTGKISKIKLEERAGELNINAHVEGSYDNEYEVDITYDTELGRFTDYACECPAYISYDGMCKHCVAVALKLMYWEEEQGEIGSFRPSSGVQQKKRTAATDRAVTGLIFASSMREKVRYFQPDVAGNVRLVPILSRKIQGWSVEFKIGAEHLYVLKDITVMIDALKEGKWFSYGQKLAFYHEKNAFTPESRRMVDFLEGCVNREQAFLKEMTLIHYSYMPSMATGRYLSLTDDKMVEFARAAGPGTIKIGSAETMDTSIKNATALHLVERDPVFTFSLMEKEDGGWQLTAPRAETFIGEKGMCIREGDTLYLCSPEFSEQMRESCRLMVPFRSAEYHINEEDLPALCASVLPALESYSVLKKPDTLERYLPKPCVLLVYLDYVDKNLTASICSEYGEIRYNMLDSLEAKDMHRDIEREQAVMKLAGVYMTHIDEKKKLLYIPEEEEDAQYYMLSTGISQMQQMAEVYITDALKRLKIIQPAKMAMGVTLNGGLLDITLQMDRLLPEELEELLSSYRRRKKYYRLKNGDFIELEDNGLSAVAELAEGLDLDAHELAEGHILVPEYRSFYLDQVLRDNEGKLQVKRNQSYKALLRSMKNIGDSDYDVPSGLHAELRPYQKFGYRWLMTLSDLGFGGILADDMGLGKTVQAIAYLVAKKEQESDHPIRNLIVCPASLVYNWESEIRRFAPDLTVETVVGSSSARSDKINSSTAAVLLTSYDLLKRDAGEYAGITFDTMFIDEAQNIKNSTTKASKAVKSIAASRRFALTGTPIENTLGELWSIFDFLMPGFLESYKKFKERYEQPIVTKQDEVVADRLRGMIRPFILRRLKKDVLKELPDKLEEVVYSQMEEEQREIYEARVQQLLNSLSRQSQEEFRMGKLQILAELTHLRQLCCDPSLVYENYNGRAAKVDTCVELVQNAVEAGNKILLFSQFTTMLDIIKARLDALGIGYYLLTGSTSKEKRNELVHAFNKDETPVFLISLKAGGTGLNLTSASIVIHFDPWWNQAAQNQATDRAHRIGQKQVVTVYKLIMKDTLEEKILKMQEQKAGLSDGIIAEGSIGDVIGGREQIMEVLKDTIHGRQAT